VKLACRFSAEIEKECVAFQRVTVAEHYSLYLLRPKVSLQSCNALISHADIEIGKCHAIIFTQTVRILVDQRYVVGPRQQL
jgi:hypothetical protein